MWFYLFYCIFNMLFYIMSTYTENHKKYYIENKDKIKERNKNNKYWLIYYEKNKEIIKKKALERYYNKKDK